MILDIPACIAPCDQACMQYLRQSGEQPASLYRCPLGLSVWQAIVLKHLETKVGTLVSFEDVARMIRTSTGYPATRDAIRGAMERLKNKGQLRYARARQGMLQGVRITQSSLPCRSAAGGGLAMTYAMPCPPHSAVQSPASIEERQNTISLSCEDRLLAITQKDYEIQFPELAKSGFGESQMRQIVQKRLRQGESLEHVLQGLRYAEWELHAGNMRDKRGETVASPCSFVFTSLIGQGHYRKPEGYISPEEAAERDRIAEAEQLRKVRRERFDAEFEAWRLGLSREELESILKGQRLTPSLQRAALRTYFETEIWPEMVGSIEVGQSKRTG
ncbi:hypothetical protein LN040_09935 [Desulfovibrio subterraneus]|uniref:hypothetical protein n=1 Tax=Desulfovibrio subterraneus TaxID=2718620 RepID=UPI0022B903B8|nr:hypothetical protein [Desulfovibrio subterraneus]WBF66052.1 hypothetical protein LN040_09935 [Desulfovibrio subterraneus]